jgi:hypothetical protein
MEDSAYMMVYGDGNFFWIFRHYENQELGQIYHISAMKFSNFTYSIALLQVHYNISFEVMSQRFINDNILMEQGCASIKKQTLC